MVTLQESMNSKLRRGQNITQNWQCSVRDAVPAEIRPRASKRTKVPIGSQVPEAPWQEWSLDMLTELERLSAATRGKLQLAQELMSLEVKQRQQDYNSHLRQAAEILKSDLERINRDLTSNSAENLQDDDGFAAGETGDEREEDGDSEGEDGDGEPKKHESELQISTDGIGQAEDTSQAAVKVEEDESDLKLADLGEGNHMAITKFADGGRKERVSKTPAPPRVSKMLQERAKILRLRADAMRLKQEAAKRQAEAFELEAKMLVAEAKQLD